MALIHGQNWDQATVPNPPSGWTFDSAPLYTSAGTVSSPPNVLAFSTPYANPAQVPHATWQTKDTAGGDVQVSSVVRFIQTTTGAGEQDVWVFARCPTVASASQWGSGLTYYYAMISRNASPAGLYLNKRVGTQVTVLGTLGAAAFADGIAYRLFLVCAGTQIQARCQRIADALWLDGTGTFVLDQTDSTSAIIVADSSIVGAGYAGMGFYAANTSGGDIVADDFALTHAPATISPTMSPQPPADLTQLLLGLLGTTQATQVDVRIVTDVESPSGESMAIADARSATSITGPYAYDDAGHTKWGFAQYA